MADKAWVTLATNDTYALGALVLAHSLKKVNTAHNLVVLITEHVSYAMKGTLQSVFNEVILVNILDSGDVENLRLLARPELGITFTKLHCWKLTQYQKCVFLDADTLVLQNCDELFNREELSAAPDVGWPDCFNSGVFVFKPSEQTYASLIEFALTHGSFDGGDQGLLNMYFRDWATSDSSKRLPFLYNLSSAAIYSYLPAFKMFGKDVKIVHFIADSKPWLQSFNTVTKTVQSSAGFSHLHQFTQYWWNLFCAYVHPQLSPEMTRLLLRGWYTPEKPIKNFPRFSPMMLYYNPVIINRTEESVIPECNEHYVFTDPWDEYERTSKSRPSIDSYRSQTPFINHSMDTMIPIVNQPTDYFCSNVTNQVMHHACDVTNTPTDSWNPVSNYFVEGTSHEQNFSNVEPSHTYFTDNQCSDVKSSDTHFSNNQCSNAECSQIFVPKNQCSDTESSQIFPRNNQCSDTVTPPVYFPNNQYTESQPCRNYVNTTSTPYNIPKNCSPELHRSSVQNNSSSYSTDLNTNISQYIPPSPVVNQVDIYSPPVEVAQNFSSLSSLNKEVLREERKVQENGDTNTINVDVGLANSFSQMSLEPTPEQIAREDFERRQNWEQGNIDYMGRDSFDKILEKITQTMSAGQETVVGAEKDSLQKISSSTDSEKLTSTTAPESPTRKAVPLTAQEKEKVKEEAKSPAESIPISVKDDIDKTKAVAYEITKPDIQPKELSVAPDPVCSLASKSVAPEKLPSDLVGQPITPKTVVPPVTNDPVCTGKPKAPPVPPLADLTCPIKPKSETHTTPATVSPPTSPLTDLACSIKPKTATHPAPVTSVPTGPIKPTPISHPVPGTATPPSPPLSDVACPIKPKPEKHPGPDIVAPLLPPLTEPLRQTHPIPAPHSSVSVSPKLEPLSSEIPITGPTHVHTPKPLIPPGGSEVSSVCGLPSKSAAPLESSDSSPVCGLKPQPERPAPVLPLRPEPQSAGSTSCHVTPIADTKKTEILPSVSAKAPGTSAKPKESVISVKETPKPQESKPSQSQEATKGVKPSKQSAPKKK